MLRPPSLSASQEIIWPGMAQVGRSAPAFACTAVVDGHLKQVSLDTYAEAKHWLILVFFPCAWSFICPTEIRAFSARVDDFVYTRACGVVFASTDSAQTLKAWNATEIAAGGLGGVHVPLLSDANHALSRAFGVLLEDEGVAQRALFIIDPRGVVRALTVHDADVGRSVDETLRVLDALVFRDQFGEGCPVDWKKGDKGIDVASGRRVEGPFEVVGQKISDELQPSQLPTLPRASVSSWSGWPMPKLPRMKSSSSQKSLVLSRQLSGPNVSPVQSRLSSVSGVGLWNVKAQDPPLVLDDQDGIVASPPPPEHILPSPAPSAE